VAFILFLCLLLDACECTLPLPAPIPSATCVDQRRQGVLLCFAHPCHSAVCIGGGLCAARKPYENGTRCLLSRGQLATCASGVCGGRDNSSAKTETSNGGAGLPVRATPPSDGWETDVVYRRARRVNDASNDGSGCEDDQIGGSGCDNSSTTVAPPTS
jgi:hypothetical protein